MSAKEQNLLSPSGEQTRQTLQGGRDRTRETECNLCASHRYRTIYPESRDSGHGRGYTITQDVTSQPYEIVSCLDCGLVYALYAESRDFLLKEYKDMKDEVYLKEERGRRRTAREVLKEISAFKKPGRLLEVGSSAGFFLDEARGLGWEVTGIEPSKWAADYASSILGLNIITKEIEAATPPRDYFDVVVMLDTLEHLTEPKAALDKTRQVLRDDGILYIATPDIESTAARIFKNRWWGIKRHHLYYFSRKTLRVLLEQAGFEIMKNSYYRRYFSLSYLFGLFSAYKGRMANGLKKVFQGASLGDKEVYFNLYDQVAVYAKKKRLLDDIIGSQELIKEGSSKLKTVIVLPAYNAARTLTRTVSDIPEGIADEVILVDDGSSDETVEVARELGLKVFTHNKNSGYGANQKTCYEQALQSGADIVVMLHPDYQYDPKVIPELIEPIKRGEADAAFGSRMMKGGALEGGMPKWKHNANILLTALENVVLGTYLSEYHSGFRAYNRRLLEAVNFKLNSNGFIFDTEIIIQALLKKFKIEEIPIKTRYFDEASSIRFFRSCLYGLGILKTLLKYILHVKRVVRFRQFE